MDRPWDIVPRRLHRPRELKMLVVQHMVDGWPEADRLERLVNSEKLARQRGDTELLAEIAAWRMEQQLK